MVSKSHVCGNIVGLKFKKKHPSVKALMERFEMPEPMKPRDALYEGRTSAVRLRYTAAADEKILYIDVTLLYLFVMCESQCYYPVILRKGFDNLTEYFGLMKVKVHSPYGLFFPVLSLRTMQDKLLFTLCRCGELDHQSGPCSRNDEERALTGFWATP